MSRSKYLYLVAFIAGGAGLLLSSVVFVAGATEETVGLTYKAKESPCPKYAKVEKCSKPDPTGLVYSLRVPAEDEDGSEKKYRHSLRLSLFVTEKDITEISGDVGFKEIEKNNYALGFSKNIKIWAANPSRDFDSFLMDGIKSASTGAPDEYHRGISQGKEQVVYDSAKCESVQPDELIPSKSPKHSECYSKRKLFQSKYYDWAYAICPRRHIGSSGIVSTPVCKISSRVIPGVFMSYQVNGGHVEDGSWIKFDMRIRDYIIGLKAR